MIVFIVCVECVVQLFCVRVVLAYHILISLRMSYVDIVVQINRYEYVVSSYNKRI